MPLTGLAPVLLVPDVANALAHYRGVLGFDVEAWSGEPSDYGEQAWGMRFGQPLERS